MKKIAILLFLMGLSLSIGQSVHYLREGFTPRRLSPFYTFMKESDKLEMDFETAEILKQPFTYLGRGRQCFAFESPDKKYVLKLPRTDIHKVPLWLRSLPFPSLREKIEQNHKRRRGLILDSFQIASKNLAKETGTLYVHKGDLLSKQTLTLVDKMGLTHRLPLESTFFALQHRHNSWTNCFLKDLKKDPSKAKETLDSLISVIEKRAKMNIINRDRSFLRNYGFDGKEAYQIDIGSFYFSDHPNAFQKSICDSIDPIESWLKEISPDLQSYLLFRKQELLKN